VVFRGLQMSSAPPVPANASSKLVRRFELAGLDAGLAGLDASLAAEITAALESNHIVYFPRCPVPLPDEATLRSLCMELPSRLRLKNISYHPRQQRLSGLNVEGGSDPALHARTTAVLREHLQAVRAFLARVVPHLYAGWTDGKCSFRPMQERGRNLPPHASNELVHIDAGAYGATDGDRILRFFVNINEREDRVWASKGTLQRLLERHGAEAGLFDASGRLRVRIEKNAVDHLRSFAVQRLARFNELARALDSSPYDRAMRRLHNYMKDSDDFKADRDGYEEIRFPPGSAWMLFTDGVTHASVSGQFALVTTVAVRRSALHHPEFAPYSLLAGRAAGRAPPPSA